MGNILEIKELNLGFKTEHGFRQAIFDVSGGDLANGVLPYLDYDIIRSHPKLFFGYSDLSVVVNAIYAKTSHPTYLYQLRNLVGSMAEIQQGMFQETLMQGGNTLFNFQPTWIQGKKMKGEVVGGNIRCFLKLAGTEYLPSFDGKILLPATISNIDIYTYFIWLTGL